MEIRFTQRTGERQAKTWVVSIGESKPLRLLANLFIVLGFVLVLHDLATNPRALADLLPSVHVLVVTVKVGLVASLGFGAWLGLTVFMLKRRCAGMPLRQVLDLPVDRRPKGLRP